MADATAQLQALVDAVVKRGGGGVELPAGTFKVAGTIEVPPTRYPVVLHGQAPVAGRWATRIVATPARRLNADGTSPDRNRCQIRGTGARLYIDNIEIDGGLGDAGYMSAFEGQHGVCFLGCPEFGVTSCFIHHTVADWVYVSRAPDGPGDVRPWSGTEGDWCELTGNMAYRSGRSGITQLGARFVHTHHNAFHHVQRSMFNLEPKSDLNGADHLRIEANVTGYSRGLFIACEGTGIVNNVGVLHNDLRGDPMDIHIADQGGGWRDSWSVVGNRSDTAMGNPQGAALVATRVRNLVATGNEQPMSRAMRFASLTECPSPLIEGNIGDNLVGQSIVRG